MGFELEPYIPYKGNKYGIVDSIYATLRMLNMPLPTKIYDPFCGGGSFAYFMARHGFTVEASDIDASIIALHNACKSSPELIKEWGKESFTKAQFKAHLTDETAHGAYIRSIWSFSNDGKTYLTSTENESNKLDEFARGVAEPNSRHTHIEDICLLWSRAKLDLNFQTRSYEGIVVGKGEMAYCDPPYSGTGGYRSGGFNHDKFYEWALAQPGLVLISEYNMPEHFVLVDKYFKWNEAGRGARGKAGEERLYSNKPNVKKLTLF